MGAKLFRAHMLKLMDRGFDRIAEALCGEFRISVRAADRLRHDAVDNAEPEKIFGGDFHRFSRIRRFRFAFAGETLVAPVLGQALAAGKSSFAPRCGRLRRCPRP